MTLLFKSHMQVSNWFSYKIQNLNIIIIIIHNNKFLKCYILNKRDGIVGIILQIFVINIIWGKKNVLLVVVAVVFFVVIIVLVFHSSIITFLPYLSSPIVSIIHSFFLHLIFISINFRFLRTKKKGKKKVKEK